jgi:methionine-rich copper-binding protein CopC
LFAPLTVLFLALATPAQAHDELLFATPAQGATVTQVPSKVVLHFEEPPAPGFTQITVTGPDGTNLDAGPLRAVGAVLTQALKPSDEIGGYTLTYRVVSDDGHPVSGRITFTVAAAGRTAKSASAGGGRPADRSAVSLIIWIGGASLFVVVLFVSRSARAARLPTPH